MQWLSHNCNRHYVAAVSAAVIAVLLFVLVPRLDTRAWEDGGGAGATKHASAAKNKRGLNRARIGEGRIWIVRFRCHEFGV
jgi:hypothetical protein